MEQHADSSGPSVVNLSLARHQAPVSWMQASKILFLKDVRAELRTKVAFSAIGVFTFSSLLLLLLATATLKEAKAFSESRFYDAYDRMQGTGTEMAVKRIVDAALFPAWNDAGKMALLWVLLCFAAFTGLAHAFVHEEETGTTLALRLAMPAAAVYAGKLLFNAMLIGTVTLLVTPVYMLITGMSMGAPAIFVATMASGCIGLAGAATIIAALAAKAHGTGALYGALGLPLLVVFLALLMNAANTVYVPHVAALQVVKDVGGLLSYGVALIGVSSITFHFVWEE
jgi:heme exporter protein B